MQYILTQEEYSALQAKVRASANAPSTEVLQKFCTKVANELIVTEGWAKGKPWGCILNEEDSAWYCDGCPAQDVCPNEYKEWSK